MKRRNFIKLLSAGSVVGVMAPKLVLANSNNKIEADEVLGNLVFTAAKQGRWNGKSKGHVPELTLTNHMLHAETYHGMSSYKHYIIKHILFDHEFNFVAEKAFMPGKDKAVSEFDVSKLKQEVHILSVCNKHDSWLNTIAL